MEEELLDKYVLLKNKIIESYQLINIETSKHIAIINNTRYYYFNIILLFNKYYEQANPLFLTRTLEHDLDIQTELLNTDKYYMYPIDKTKINITGDKVTIVLNALYKI